MLLDRFKNLILKKKSKFIEQAIKSRVHNSENLY